MCDQVRSAFGTDAPHANSFLLHAAPGWQDHGQATPVVLVPGAFDDATRRWALPHQEGGHDDPRPGLMSYLAGRGSPVFAVTYSHNHGDNIYQGEALANAIQRVRSLLGRQDDATFQVNLVAHSKGAMSVRSYVQSASGFYSDRKFLTPFRGDVSRVAFIASPLGGLDLPYRYYIYNLQQFTQSGRAPVAASRMILYGFWKDAGPSYLLSGHYPGQLQMLFDLRKRGVPYGLMSCTADANDSMHRLVDGGRSFFVESEGIEHAIAEGGSLIEKLNSVGFPRSVASAVLAGNKPVLYDPRLLPFRIPIGMEITAPSDGLLFVKSALYTEGLTVGGASLLDQKTMFLDHIELTQDEDAFAWVDQMVGSGFASESR